MTPTACDPTRNLIEFARAATSIDTLPVTRICSGSLVGCNVAAKSVAPVRNCLTITQHGWLICTAIEYELAGTA